MTTTQIITVKFTLRAETYHKAGLELARTLNNCLLQTEQGKENQYPEGTVLNFYITEESEQAKK